MPGVVEALRWEVYSLDDGRCVAAVIDPFAGPCYDRWGKVIDSAPRLTFEQCEMDFCRYEAVGPRHTLPDDHVILCPGHHRGTGPSRGYQWATSHRADEREYLRKRLTASRG